MLTQHKIINPEKIFESLATALMAVDSDGQIVFANAAAENILDMSIKRLLGFNVNDLFLTSKSFIDLIDRGHKAEFAFSRHGLDLTLPSLKHVKVDCIFTPMLDEDRVLIEVIQVDKKLRIEKEDNIVAQQNVLKLLVKGLAHEVKNPLGGIRGAAQLLELELPTRELSEYTQIIIGEVDRLQALVDGMLGPNRPLNKELINIHSVLEHVRQLVEAESGDKLEIQRNYDPSLPDLHADRNQLIQAVLNIVRNAKQAIQGNGTIQLKSRSRRNVRIGDEYYKLLIQLDITDNGPGIDEKFIDQIFYPMVTGRVEGTGLGLSISQTLIAQHGGLIECTSEPGNTVFTILLPFNNKK